MESFRTFSSLELVRANACNRYVSIVHSSGMRQQTKGTVLLVCICQRHTKRTVPLVCGWRHGNSFPLTQSAQSHRQMRSIPHCPKAVFYVFVFDSIHDSATMYNHCPSNFPLCQYRPVDLVDQLTLGYTKMEAALFLVGKGEPPSLSSYFNFTFTCDLSIQRRREI